MPIQVDPAAFLVGVLGLVAVCIQLWLGARRERFENTFRLIERLQEPDAINFRHRLREVMETARAGGYDFHKMDEEDDAGVSNLVSLFGLVGFFAKRRLVRTDILMAGWAATIKINYERAKPYIDWRDSLYFGARGSLRGDFKWLAEKADRYLKWEKAKEAARKTPGPSKTRQTPDRAKATDHEMPTPDQANV